MFMAINSDDKWKGVVRPGKYIVNAIIPENLFNEGYFTLGISVVTLKSGQKSHKRIFEDLVCGFNIFDLAEGDTSRGHFHGSWPGDIRPLLKWETEFV